MTAPGSYNANVVLSADINQYQQAMGQAAQVTNQTTSAVSRLGQTYQDTKQKVKGKLLDYDRASLATLAGATAAAALYQKQLSTLSAQSAVTGQSMKTLRGSIDNTFKTLPVARGDLVQLAQTISQLGVTSNREIGSMVGIFTKLSAATGGSATSLAASMLQFTNAMGDMSSRNVKAMSNSLVSLADSEHLAAENIISFAQAIAPIARVAGITENQVLGLSTAFTKAGQDGFVAANTFSSMLEDITQMTATGSPALAKYANILGLTVQQFNAMPRAQAIAQLFTTISSQGSRGISTLDQLGVNGVRAIRSIQAVVQSGDLATLAGGGSTTGDQMNKGANAAFNNLADSLAVSRNEMVQYGTVIGMSLIGPLNSAVKVVNTLIRSLGFLQPVLAVPIAALGLLGSAIAPIMSFAAPLVAARWLRASPMGRGALYGFGAGRRAGNPEELARYQAEMEQRLTAQNARIMQRRAGLVASGMSEEEAAARMPLLTNTRYDEMGHIQRFFYRMGAYPGSRLGMFTPTPGTDRAAFFAGLRNYAVTSPLRAVSWLAGANTNWYQNSMGAGGPFSMRTGTAAFNTPSADRFFRSFTFSGLRDPEETGWRAYSSGIRGIANRFQARIGLFTGGGTGLTEEEQAVRRDMMSGKITEESERFQNAVRGMAKRMQERIIAEGDGVAASKALSREFGIMTRNVAMLSGSTVKASASVLGAGVRALPGMGVVRGAATGLGRFAYGLGRDLFGSPLGAVLTGATIGMGAYSYFQSDNRKQQDLATKYLNPIQQYNTQLGIASTNLASFTNNLQDATEAAKAFTPSSYQQVTQSISTLAASAPNKPLNDVWNAVRQMQGSTQRNALNVLSTIPISDPRQLAAVAQDMLAAGIDQGTVQTTIQQYMANGGPNKITGLGRNLNLANLGQQAAITEGVGQNFSAAALKQSLYQTTIGAAKNIGKSIGGVFGIGGGADWVQLEKANQSQRGAAIIGSAVSGIQSAYQNELQTRGAPFATVQRLQQMLTLFGQLAPGAAENTFGGGARREALARGLSNFTGTSYSDLIGRLTSGNERGQLQLGALTTRSSTVSKESAIIRILASTSGGKDWLNRQAQALGLSDYTQLNPAHFNKMLLNAQNNVAGAGGDFQNFLAGLGPGGRFAAGNRSVMQALGAESGSPRVQTRAQESLVLYYQSHSKSLQNASANLEKLANKVGGSSTLMGQLAEAAKGVIDQMVAWKLPEMSRMQQMGAAITGLQLAYNAPQDENYQKNLNQAQGFYHQSKDQYAQYLQGMYSQLRDYDTQRYREEKDYQRSVNRANAAFYLQQKYAEQDFQRQMFRAKRDFNRQMQYQARASAQSVYDPYTRILSKPTTSAGVLMEDLGDQNRALQRQMKEVKALNQMGLSKEAIQTLDLANPNNAQQLDRLFLQARDDPSIIVQLNALTAKRLRLTKNLTQNDFNLSFQQTNQQFTQGLKDATRDYNTARDRAVTAQHIALNQMAQDYNTMIRRSGKDLKTSMTELSNDFATNFRNVMKLVTGELGHYAPQAAAMIEKQLNKLRRKYPGLFDKNYTGALPTPDPGTATTADRNVAKTAAASTFSAPNVIGITSKGDFGYYDPSGKFHTMKMPSNWRMYPHIVSPKTGHRMGGISTFEHTANISEGNTPEQIIPLDQRGLNYMAESYRMIASQIVKQSGGATVYGGNRTYVDNSTNFTGPISITAENTKQLIQELKNEQRIARLSKPAHASVNT